MNGRIVRTLGTTVASGDRIEVDGRAAQISREHRYVMLHKPAKVMTTMRDPEGRRTVADLIPPEVGRVVPVGRLDYETSGLLLMTDDGDLANVLAHPRFGVEKTYRAIVRGRLDETDVRRFRDGIRLEEGPTHPAKVRVVRTSRGASEIDITIHEGRNRQVRRMFEALGHPVSSLTRTRFGPLALGSLRPGRWRELSLKEVGALRAIGRTLPPG